jgi:SagB-type dehydrogenase family enzyme
MASAGRKRASRNSIVCIAPVLALLWSGCTAAATRGPTEGEVLSALPAPRTAGPLSDDELSQLLWAAQGETDARGYRAAPSAGALYPLEIYLVTEKGLYHYEPDAHALTPLDKGDLREGVWRAGLEQESLRDAPAVFVLTAVYERTKIKYGARAERYVHLEAGHAAQNLLLQAVALDLGAVPIGAFDDQGVQAALSLPEDHEPLYLIPVGRPPD